MPRPPVRLAARLKRDAPEIAARIDDFPSMRAAALAAGIIRERTEAGLRRTIVETQRTSGGTQRTFGGERHPSKSGPVTLLTATAD
jgi:hypothetical protein